MQPLLDRSKVAPHFRAFKWNYMPKSILDGNHGEVRVDNVKQPNVSVLHFPRLPLFLVGGNPGHPAARRFIKRLAPRSFLIFADRTEAWHDLCRELHGIKTYESTRYAFTSENLDLAHLRRLRDGLPEGFTLRRIDQALARQIVADKTPLTEDHMVTFDSPTDFLNKGFGFAVLKGEQIVSLASTFVVCDAGIEVQINTHRKYEGRGLGTAVGAALIAHSLEQGLDPGWDAANETSAHLAKKFGYTPQGEYPMYVVFGSKLFVGFMLFLRKILKRE